jgi:hypothetical protein
MNIEQFEQEANKRLSKVVWKAVNPDAIPAVIENVLAIMVAKQKQCPVCKGHKGVPGDKACHNCNGTGTRPDEVEAVLTELKKVHNYLDAVSQNLRSKYSNLSDEDLNVLDSFLDPAIILIEEIRNQRNKKEST